MRALKSALVMKVAEDFREEVLARAANDTYLGSEEELILRLGVSRPTFREVARILEYEQLLTIKRGPGGGYFARVPTHAAVTHVATILLRTRGATMADIGVCATPLLREAVRLAAGAEDRQSRRKLQALLKSYATEDISAEQVSSLEVTFIETVTELCGNPVIRLFVHVLFDFGKGRERSHLKADDDRTAYCAMQTAIIQAILDGDSDAAEKHVVRRSIFIRSWFAAKSRSSRRRVSSLKPAE